MFISFRAPNRVRPRGLRAGLHTVGRALTSQALPKPFTISTTYRGHAGYAFCKKNVKAASRTVHDDDFSAACSAVKTAQTQRRHIMDYASLKMSLSYWDSEERPPMDVQGTCKHAL